jgi:membrane protein DedA with SNARE-associated domain
LISIPAGLGRMNILRFSIYTIVGAALWNSFLTWLGYHLRDKWETIRQYTQIIDVVLIVLICAAIGYFVYRHLRSMRRA